MSPGDKYYQFYKNAPIVMTMVVVMIVVMVVAAMVTNLGNMGH